MGWWMGRAEWKGGCCDGGAVDEGAKWLCVGGGAVLRNVGFVALVNCAKSGKMGFCTW